MTDIRITPKMQLGLVALLLAAIAAAFAAQGPELRRYLKMERM